MATTKDERIQIRVMPEIRDGFDPVAGHRGLTGSALLHSRIVLTIREPKEEKPWIFQSPPVKTLEEAKADDKEKASRARKSADEK